MVVGGEGRVEREKGEKQGMKENLREQDGQNSGIIKTESKERDNLLREPLWD